MAWLNIREWKQSFDPKTGSHHFSHKQHGTVSVVKNPAGQHEVRHAGGLAGLRGVKPIFANHQQALRHAVQYMHSLAIGMVAAKKPKDEPSGATNGKFTAPKLPEPTQKEEIGAKTPAANTNQQMGQPAGGQPGASGVSPTGWAAFQSGFNTAIGVKKAEPGINKPFAPGTSVGNKLQAQGAKIQAAKQLAAKDPKIDWQSIIRETDRLVERARAKKPIKKTEDYFRGFLRRPSPKSPEPLRKEPSLSKVYASDAQRRWAHTPAGKKALGGEKAVAHWDKASKGKKLPEKVSKAEPSLNKADAHAAPAPSTPARHNPIRENRRRLKSLKRDIKSQYDPIRIATKAVASSPSPESHPDFQSYQKYITPTQGKDGKRQYRVDFTKIAMDVAKQHYETAPQRFVPEITTGNAKTQRHGIALFDLPAIKTCPGADQCKDICYAESGQIRNTGKLIRHAINYYASQRPEFVDEMDKLIKHLPHHGESRDDKRRWGERFRVHGYGDFYSPEYASKWAEIIRRNPQVGKFYAYTKSYSLPNIGKILWGAVDSTPNFTLRQSIGARQNRHFDPRRPSAVIAENDQQVHSGKKAGMVYCHDDDRLASDPANKIILLKAHGALARRHSIEKHLAGLPPQVQRQFLQIFKGIRKAEIGIPSADDQSLPRIDISDHYTQPDEAMHDKGRTLRHLLKGYKR